MTPHEYLGPVPGGPVHSDPGKFKNAFLRIGQPYVYTETAFWLNENGTFQKHSPKCVNLKSLRASKRIIFKLTRVNVDGKH